MRSILYPTRSLVTRGVMASKRERGGRRLGRPALFWLSCALSVSSGCAFFHGIPTEGGPSRGVQRFAPEPELQALFDPRPRERGLSWLGGDVASSARLSADRYVWIFGDTLLGTVSDRCESGVRYCERDIDDDVDRGVIPNSVGIMRRDASGAFAPLEFHWRTIEGEPAPIFASADPDEFLWPLAVLRVDRVLMVAASRHARARGLESLGNVYVRVENPDQEPERWTYSRHPVSEFDDGSEGREPVAWATALIRKGPYVYVFGQLGEALEARTVVSRLRVDGIAGARWDPEPEFLQVAPEPTKGEAKGEWSRDFDVSRAYVLPGLPGTSEATVVFSERSGWSSYRIAPFAFEVHLFTAPDLLGPWVDRGSVYDVPPPWSTARESCGDAPAGCPQRYIAYAPKEHRELGGEEGLVLTYNVNLLDGSLRAAERAAETEHGFYVPAVVACRYRADGRCLPP